MIEKFRDATQVWDHKKFEEVKKWPVLHDFYTRLHKLFFDLTVQEIKAWEKEMAEVTKKKYLYTNGNEFEAITYEKVLDKAKEMKLDEDSLTEESLKEIVDGLSLDMLKIVL